MKRSILHLILAFLPLAVWSCAPDSAPPAATAPATATPATAPARPAPAAPAAATPAQIHQWTADLSAEDGQKRLAATQAIFKLGPAAVEALRQAGAQQVSPFPAGANRRLDIVYSLLVGLEPNPPGGRAGYATNSFGIHVDKGCTGEEINKLGEKHGFALSGTFQPEGHPACYVTLKPGKYLDEVLEALLSNEPQIVSVNLNYVEQ